MTTSDNTPQLVPVGSILAYAGDPSGLFSLGWLNCNGDPLDREEYRELYEKIRTNFGAPNANSFNLPKLQGMFLRGASPAAIPNVDPDVGEREALQPGGNTGGNVGSKQLYGTAPAKTPFRATISRSNIGNETSSHGGCNDKSAKYSGATTEVDISEGGDSESRPVNKYVYFIVKYQSVDLSQNFVKVPVGAVVPFAGIDPSSLGDRWKLCNGETLAVSEYQALHAAIGFAHGKVSDSQFVLPDFRGYFLRGVDGGAGVDPDRGSRGWAYPQGQTDANKGNNGDRVGSSQPCATGFPTRGRALKTTFSNLPTTDERKEDEWGENATVYKWESTSPKVSVSCTGEGCGGDDETRPTNFSVDWYIRCR